MLGYQAELQCHPAFEPQNLRLDVKCEVFRSLRHGGMTVCPSASPSKLVDLVGTAPQGGPQDLLHPFQLSPGTTGRVVFNQGQRRCQESGSGALPGGNTRSFSSLYLALSSQVFRPLVTLFFESNLRATCGFTLRPYPSLAFSNNGKS